MSNVPQGYRFLKSHEWARQDADGRIVIGISDHAQSALGDLVYVDLPTTGQTLNAGETCAVVESVKAASDVYSPVSGTVVAVNAVLADAPETINQSPYDAGWLFAVEPSGKEFDALLGDVAYGQQLEADGH
jgi:glycine cleavage system H protein